MVNYDIHWNPVRLIQRLGRIDRIGSWHTQIKMINYWPMPDMEKYLNLGNRVEARMALADAMGTGDSNPLDKSQVTEDLERRDQQYVKQLRSQFYSERLDLDDLSEGLNFSDLSLDHFVHQLWNYLESYRDKLENMPNGIYAAVKAEKEQDEGVIFVLKHKNQQKADARKYNHSPVMPYYLVYVSRTGEIKIGCARTQKLLNRFNDLAVNEKEPDKTLCDAFDAEIQQGDDMELYDQLLGTTVKHIQGIFRQSVSRKKGATTPKLSERPNTPDDFELITWLVLKRARHS